MKKENEFIVFFGHNIISNGLYQVIRNNIVAKKTTELVHLFHKNKTKLVFLWPNMSQKSFKVLVTTLLSKTNTVHELSPFHTKALFISRF